MGAEHHGLGPVVQAVLDGGQGRHYPGIVRDLALLLGHVEVTPAQNKLKIRQRSSG